MYETCNRIADDFILKCEHLLFSNYYFNTFVPTLKLLIDIKTLPRWDYVTKSNKIIQNI